MTDMKTLYAGLTLRNPLMVGSSGLTNNPERNKEFEKAGAGAIVLKSIFEEQIEMQGNTPAQDPAHAETTDYTLCYLELIKRTKELCTIPVFSSINCCHAGEWVDFARQTELAGADAIELNVFSLPTNTSYTSDETFCTCVDILRKVKATVTIPIVMKIGKNMDNIPALVNTLKANGADGVVMFNRFYQPDIDINHLQMVSGNVFSNHSDLSDTIRWTAIVSGKVPGISIVSSTGVHDWEDAAKCLLAGASAVQLCSALYTHGSEIIPQMLTCLEEWMHQMQFQSLAQLRGKLDYSNIPDPAIFERSQFMKYFSNRD